MKSYIKGKYCIYLDQFAVSNLAEGLKQWLPIRELINEGFKQGKLFCPLSIQHIIETSGKRNENALPHHNYLVSISSGFCIKEEAFITAQLLISAVRNNNITYNTFIRKFNPAYNYQEHLGIQRSRRSEFASMIQEVKDLEEQLDSNSELMSFKLQKPLMQEIRSEKIREFCERIEELITFGGIKVRGVKFKTREVPYWIDYIIDILLKKNKMVEKEGKLLLQHLKSHGFDHISTLDVRSTLESISTIKRKKKSTNDEVDIMRIASAIQVSDIMLIDKSKKNELIETGLAEKYRIKVFSGTVEDLKSFIELLENIL